MAHKWKTGGYVFPCYTYVCSVMGGFSYFGFKLKTNSYQIASLFHMYIDMDERIAGKQGKPSLIIEDPLKAPKIAQNILFFLHFGP